MSLSKRHSSKSPASPATSSPGTTSNTPPEGTYEPVSHRRLAKFRLRASSTANSPQLKTGDVSSRKQKLSLRQRIKALTGGADNKAADDRSTHSKRQRNSAKFIQLFTKRTDEPDSTRSARQQKKQKPKEGSRKQAVHSPVPVNEHPRETREATAPAASPPPPVPSAPAKQPSPREPSPEVVPTTQSNASVSPTNSNVASLFTVNTQMSQKSAGMQPKPHNSLSESENAPTVFEVIGAPVRPAHASLRSHKHDVEGGEEPKAESDAARAVVCTDNTPTAMLILSPPSEKK